MSQVPDPLQRMHPSRRLADESLTCNGRSLGIPVSEFWGWCMSDLVANVTRGAFAEFIVARALEMPAGDVRDPWAPFDLETPDGLKVEVKASAYLQSWAQRQLSSIQFSIREARAYDAETNTLAIHESRSADVYVFCLLTHDDKATVNPLNLDQWEFYVLPTSSVNAYPRSHSSITLKSLQALTEPVSFDALSAAIRTAWQANDRSDESASARHYVAIPDGWDSLSEEEQHEVAIGMAEQLQRALGADE